MIRATRTHLTPLEELPQVDPRWQHHLLLPARGHLPGARMAVLDTHSPAMRVEGADPQAVDRVLVCVHGNPTWSYLWRRVLAAAPAGWRVIAVDHVGMGHSERSTTTRRLRDRIDDLDEALHQLGVLGGEHGDLPVSVMVHDWGGTIGLGWAARHSERIASTVITNTALWQPDRRVPPGIRAARAAGLHRPATVDTATFVRAASWVGRPGPDPEVARALASPYTHRDLRRAVGDFVADIPLEASHPSRTTLEEVAAGAEALDVPALVLWGGADPVFTDRYLRDVLERFPGADVHRWGDASHLVLEDRPEGVDLAWAWLDEGTARPDSAPVTSQDRPVPDGPSAGDAEGAPTTLWSRLTERASSSPGDVAVVELAGGDRRTVTFGELEQRVDHLARGLRAHGVRRGTRVAVLVPPGIDLTAVVYAVWRAGASVVVADAGLGVRAMAGALRSADPQLVVGVPAGLAAARTLGVEGQPVVVHPAGSGAGARALGRVTGAQLTLEALEADGTQDAGTAPGPLTVPSVDDEAAVLFTSGATGPSKGVVYRHRQLLAQRDVVEQALGLRPGDSLVAAFAPFALYGPALGMTSAVPDMDVTRPDTLTAAALADAVTTVGADVVFASPAALRNVVATRDDVPPMKGVRTVMSAGAPVPVELLEQVHDLAPGADTVTPYGMTEALPLTVIDPRTVDAADLAAHAGVCVGRPVPGVDLRIAPLDDRGEPAGDDGLVETPGVTGEIVASAPHVKSHYDRLWGTQRATAHPAGWHRTGDVGHLDDAGRLWVEGRGIHTVTTEVGPVTPGGIEARVETLEGVRQAAVVGVGPGGRQRVVVVVRPEDLATARLHPASPVAAAELSAAVRRAAADGPGAAPVSAVLVRETLPVDIRHASKIDRAALADWATDTLAGDGGRASASPRGPRRLAEAVRGRLDRVGFRP